MNEETKKNGDKCHWIGHLLRGETHKRQIGKIRKRLAGMGWMVAKGKKQP
jgi:hypothetical protein